MRTLLSKNQIEDLLDNVIGVTKRLHWKGDKLQFTCPVHNESHPSCGINADFRGTSGLEHLQVLHCFSCGESGTLPWLLFRSLDEFRSLEQAETFMTERYGVTFSYLSKESPVSIREYEEMFVEEAETRFELPFSRLAVFKSGKETYQYFFDRGFTVEDMKEYMIGRDLENETFTVPAFWEDGTLAGIIGRYIDPSRPKNMRFRIYDFPKGALLYPLDKVKVTDGVLICTEAMLDAIMLRKWGYLNAVASMGDSMSAAQMSQVCELCRTLIVVYDNDVRGREAALKLQNKLKDRVQVKIPTYFPEHGKDPIEWGEIETAKVIKSARSFGAIPTFD